jgi:hypothetical protein
VDSSCSGSSLKKHNATLKWLKDVYGSTLVSSAMFLITKMLDSDELSNWYHEVPS